MTCLSLLVEVHSVHMSCQEKYVSDKDAVLVVFPRTHSQNGLFTSFHSLG